MYPSLEFDNKDENGQVLFFLIYRLHKDEDRPGAGNQIWRPIYKSEIKTQEILKKLTF